MNKELQKQLQKQLAEEKKKLLKDLEGFAKKDPRLRGDWDTQFPQFGIHRSEQDENIEEVEKYENLLPVEHTLELRLQDIERALAKIKKDAYGKCEKCQKEIEIERLKACPEAKLCMKCK